MSIYSPKNSYSHPEACYALNLTQFEMNIHRHPRCEVMYVADGACQVEVDGVLHTLRHRQLVFLDAEVPHRLLMPQNSHCSLLNLEFVCCDEPNGVNYRHIQQQDAPFAAFLSQKQRVAFLFDSGKFGYALKDFISELNDRREENSYLLGLQFRRVLLELARCTVGSAKGSGTHYLRKARGYINDHLNEELNATRIADAVGINHSYLQTLFSRAMGCGLMSYVSHQRLERASFLLKNSSMSITDIAFQVGFNSRQHFSFTFEKRYGMSPREYRKLYHEQLDADTVSGQLLLDREDGILPFDTNVLSP